VSSVVKVLKAITTEDAEVSERTLKTIMRLIRQFVYFQYNPLVPEQKPFRLTESVKAAG
jgi:hypothetical protein